MGWEIAAAVVVLVIGLGAWTQISGLKARLECCQAPLQIRETHNGGKEIAFNIAGPASGTPTTARPLVTFGPGMNAEAVHPYGVASLAVAMPPLLSASVICLVCVLAPAAAAPLLEVRPMGKVPVPEIRNWSTLRIRLQRGMCFGTCPAYSVEISGDGTVNYEGDHFVAVTGKVRSHIRQAAARDLYRRFVKADFFSHIGVYKSRVTDMPSYQMRISFDRDSYQVEDYMGLSVGMPTAIAALEGAIDEAAGTKKWVGRP